MTMRAYIYSLIILSVFTSTASKAVEDNNKNYNIPGEFSGTISLFSEHVFRGISQTDESPSIQGSFHWSHDNGFYLGSWATNVDYNDGDEAHIEIDYYGGFGFGEGSTSVDIGAAYYTYPGADSGLNYDYFEAYTKVSYNFDFLSLTGSLYLTPEFFGDAGHAEYYELAASAPLFFDLTFTTRFGHQEIEDNTVAALPDYSDWSAGLWYPIEDFTLGAQYTDTNLSKSECADGCEARAVLSISRNF